MKRMMLSNLLLFLIAPFLVFGEIHEVSTFNQLLPYFEQTEETLVLFDVDEVLLVIKEPAFQVATCAIPENLEAIKKIKANLTPQQRNYLTNLKLLHDEGQLMNMQMPGLISNLQNKGVPVAALTASANYELEGVDLAENRYQKLKKVGIDFSQSFPSAEEVIFTNLNLACGSYPSFRKGILFTNGEIQGDTGGTNTKGTVLLSFLCSFKLNPKTILFIDDKERNLVSVEKELMQNRPDVKFIGLHYRECDLLDAPEVDLGVVKKRWQEFADRAVNWDIALHGNGIESP